MDFALHIPLMFPANTCYAGHVSVDSLLCITTCRIFGIESLVCEM